MLFNNWVYTVLLSILAVDGSMNLKNIAFSCGGCGKIKDCDVSALVKRSPKTIAALSEWLATCSVEVPSGAVTSLSATAELQSDVVCVGDKGILIDTQDLMGAYAPKSSQITLSPAQKTSKASTYTWEFVNGTGGSMSSCTLATPDETGKFPLEPADNGLVVSSKFVFDGDFWLLRPSNIAAMTSKTVSFSIQIALTGAGDGEDGIVSRIASPSAMLGTLILAFSAFLFVGIW